MLDIITSGSLGSISGNFGLVLAPFTFSVQILSLLALLTLFIFVPVSLLGIAARLAGLSGGPQERGTGGLIKQVAGRFGMYVAYHVLMFGIWFLLAGLLIPHLYQTVADKPGSSYSKASGRVEIALNNETKPTVSHESASPTDNTGITNTESNQLRAPFPNAPIEDRMVPNEYPSRYPPTNNRITPALRAYPTPLSENPYPPYDPIYTKSDILGATYLLILIYPLLFVVYVVLWALVSANFMYLVRKSQGKNPFKPTLMQYARLALWNASIFGLVAAIIHQLALY